MFRKLVRRWISDRERWQRDQYAGLLAVVGVIGLLFSILWLVVLQFEGKPSAFGLGSLILFGSAAAGAALGFLFSVPRVLSTGEVEPASAGGGALGADKRLLGSNTNLERISEWLTTMIVGVGLSQITNLGTFLGSLSRFLGVSGAPALVTAAPFVLLIGFVGGFVALYLYTRLYLSPLFLYVERQLIQERQPGAGVVPTDQEEIRKLAKQMAEKDGGSVMRYIATVDQISLDQTMHVLAGLLYEEGGYETVLKIGRDLKGTPAEEMGRYWYLMAAANGQKHHDMLEGAGAPSELPKARQAVLDATRKATELDPVYKHRLLNLTEGEGGEDDLRDFANDPDFLKMVR